MNEYNDFDIAECETDAFKRGYKQGKAEAIRWIPAGIPPKKEKRFYLVTLRGRGGKRMTHSLFYIDKRWIDMTIAADVTSSVVYWAHLPKPKED